MRRVEDRFGGYRGRRTLHDNLKLIAVVLAVAVVVALGALFLGQNYIVYTDDGVKLELPFLRPAGETSVPGSVSYVELPNP